MVFCSALAELQRLNLLDSEGADATDGIAHGNLDAAPDVLSCDDLFKLFEAYGKPGEVTTVGMAGYPNVGKSSLINALVGEKKVSMSRQPGHTKHFQTIELPQRQLRLCDCPGLVFPSIVATKAHLVIRGVQPIDVCQDTIGPVQIIVTKIGVDNVLRFYGGQEHPARFVCSAFAMARGHLLKMKEPDLQWSARRILKDFATGALLYVEMPPGMERPQAEPDVAAEEAAAEAAFCAAENVADVEDFLAEHPDPEDEASRLEQAVGKMNKRQLRQMHKSMMRGKMQVRTDGTFDPFTNQQQRVGSVALGNEA